LKTSYYKNGRSGRMSASQNERNLRDGGSRHWEDESPSRKDSGQEGGQDGSALGVDEASQEKIVARVEADQEELEVSKEKIDHGRAL
jgi:hypothetical protein